MRLFIRLTQNILLLFPTYIALVTIRQEDSINSFITYPIDLYITITLLLIQIGFVHSALFFTNSKIPLRINKDLAIKKTLHYILKIPLKTVSVAIYLVIQIIIFANFLDGFSPGWNHSSGLYGKAFSLVINILFTLILIVPVVSPIIFMSLAIFLENFIVTIEKPKAKIKKNKHL